MTTKKTRGRPPTMLEAAGADAKPLEPWFRDSRKLLAAVVDRARIDDAFAIEVTGAIAALAEGNKRLSAGLRESSAARARSMKWDYWHYLLLLTNFAAKRELGMRPGAAKTAIAKAEIFGSISTGMIGNKLSQARKLVDPDHLPEGLRKFAFTKYR